MTSRASNARRRIRLGSGLSTGAAGALSVVACDLRDHRPVGAGRRECRSVAASPAERRPVALAKCLLDLLKSAAGCLELGRRLDSRS